MTQAKYEENCITMWNQSYEIESSKKQFSRIWILSNGNIDEQDNNVYKLFRTDGNTTNYSIIAANNIKIKNVNWTIAINLYDDSNNYFYQFIKIEIWNVKRN